MSSGTIDFDTLRMDDLRSRSNITEHTNPNQEHVDYIRLLQENKKLETSYLLSVGIACHDAKFRRRLSALTKLEDTLKKTLTEKCELLKTINKYSRDVEEQDQVRKDLERKVFSLQKVLFHPG
ncbi:uncharacterized protein LOC121389191 [Gigantopelta aegis]|uniref:uncharacterized protein LOC121389191 n=1 Tax=Gigantopelta aegis TaxID=1735272 RepID=UPI001B88D57E|nr:uncharacterized protein LOC121389191 [Gigantopelta aegis]